jgi:hypothetical protein
VNIIPEGVTVDEYLNAKRIAAVADLIDNGKVSFNKQKAIDAAFNKNKNNKSYVEKLILGMRSEAGKTWRQAMKQTDRAKRAELMDKAEQLRHDAKGLKTILGDDKITSGATPSYILKGVAGTHNQVKNQMPRGVIHDVINKNPELYNYAYWKNAPWYANVENAVHQAWPSLVVNKAGKTDYASDVVRATKDITEQNRKESKEQSKKAQVSKIISARPELSSTDLKWLNAIKENPDIVRDGYNKGSVKDADDFKMWLLMGGNDLLRGSDVHRPLWDIE